MTSRPAVRDWKDVGRKAARYAASRPYGLLPWIALVGAVALWPKAKPAPEPLIVEPPPGLSDGRVMTPSCFETEEPGRGRAARHPAHIPLLGWRDIAWRVGIEIGADKLPSVAGGVTFYSLLAIFPAIAAFVSVYGLFADVATVREQLASLSGVFPASVIQIVGEQMMRLAGQQQAKLTVALVLSLLLSVWSANAGMKALFEGLNVAYDEVERRPFFTKTAITYASTFGALLFLAATAGLLIGLPWALEAIGLRTMDWLWAPLRWLVLVLMATGAFGLVYRYGPCRARARWRWVTIGAVVAAVMWIVGSLGFSWYVNNLAHFDETYGPLGTVIGFMLWVWFSVMVLLIGAELNAEVEHQTAQDTTTGLERPMGERGAAMADTVGQALRFREMLKRQGRQVAGLWTRLVAKLPRRLPGRPGAPPDPRR